MQTCGQLGAAGLPRHAHDEDSAVVGRAAEIRRPVEVAVAPLDHRRERLQSVFALLPKECRVVNVPLGVILNTVP